MSRCSAISHQPSAMAAIEYLAAEVLMSKYRVALGLALLAIGTPSIAQDRLQSSDLLRLRSVSSVEVSPDGTRLAYTVDNNDGPGRPYGQLWIMTVADGKTV